MAPLWKLPAAPLTQTGKVVGAGALELAGGTTGVVVQDVVGTGVLLHVVTTTMGVGGTVSVVQGMMTVRVASLQVEAGSSHLVQGVVVVQPTVTHSVAVQVTVVVHQSQIGRVVGCHGLREVDLGGGG
jgi:hypothetical protein